MNIVVHSYTQLLSQNRLSMTNHLSVLIKKGVIQRLSLKTP